MIYDDVPGRDNLLKWMERHLQYNTWIKTRKQTGNCYMMLYGNHETCRNHEKLGHCIAHTFAKYSIVPVKVNKYYMEMWWNVVCVCFPWLACPATAVLLLKRQTCNDSRTDHDYDGMSAMYSLVGGSTPYPKIYMLVNLNHHPTFRNPYIEFVFPCFPCLIHSVSRLLLCMFLADFHIYGQWGRWNSPDIFLS